MIFEIADFVLIFLIFLSRIIDVSIGTLRLIFVSKGYKYLAPVLGFFEILVWIVVVSKLMRDNAGTILYVSYAAGFAAGTYMGMLLEEKLSIGKIMIRVITQTGFKELIKNLKESEYPITVSDAKGKKGDVKIIFSVIDKKKLKKFLKIIKETNPKAFYSIEDVRYANCAEPLPIIPRRTWGVRKFK